MSEVVSLDGLLCRRLLHEIQDGDWGHLETESPHFGFFHDLPHLIRRTAAIPRRNILAVYREPAVPAETAPPGGDFEFIGYELLDEESGISALTNCGGFPGVFQNAELNRFGLLDSFEWAREVRRQLPIHCPDEPHAVCGLYAVWRLREP